MVINDDLWQQLLGHVPSILFTSARLERKNSIEVNLTGGGLGKVLSEFDFHI